MVVLHPTALSYVSSKRRCCLGWRSIFWTGIGLFVRRGIDYAALGTQWSFSEELLFLPLELVDVVSCIQLLSEWIDDDTGCASFRAA